MITDNKSNVKLENVDGDKRKAEMKRLSKWNVNFGKFKGKKFEEMGKDRDYSIWILNQSDFISKNEALKKYLEFTLTSPIL
jgi:hypothetical protein